MKAAPWRSGLSHFFLLITETSSSYPMLSQDEFHEIPSLPSLLHPVLPPCRFQYFLNEKENPEFFRVLSDIKVHLVPLFSSHKSSLRIRKPPLLFPVFSPDFSYWAGREAGEKAAPSFQITLRHCQPSQSLTIVINKIRPIDIKYSLSLWEYTTIGWLRAGLPNRVGHRWATIAVGETQFRLRPFP